MDGLTNGYVEAKSYVSCQDRYSVYGCKNSYEKWLYMQFWLYNYSFEYVLPPLCIYTKLGEDMVYFGVLSRPTPSLV